MNLAYLMDRCQIAVSVGECWVDGDGFVIAPDCGSRVANFLEGVAEIRVGVGKRRLDANRLSIMLKRLVETPLLLQHRG